MDKLSAMLSDPKIIITRNMLKLIALIGATVNSLYCMYIYASMPFLLLIGSNILLQVLTSYFAIESTLCGVEVYENKKYKKVEEGQ